MKRTPIATGDTTNTTTDHTKADSRPTSTTSESSASSAIASSGNGNYNNQLLSDAVIQTIVRFTPKMSRQAWNGTAEFTRSAVTDFAPHHEREAQLILTAVARLTAWSVDVACLPLERTAIFHGGNVEAYIARGIPAGSKYTTATSRRLLMRVARELGAVDMGRVTSRPANRPRMMEPYSAKEIASFRSMAQNRSTEHRRHNWNTYLCLAGGCGLSTLEIPLIRRADIFATERWVSVHVAGREVICSGLFENALRRAYASAHGGDYVFAIETTLDRRDHRNSVNHFLRSAANGEPVPSAGRLRATWIVNHLNAGTNVVAMMRALGITSMRPLEQYLPFVEPPQTEVVATQLRGEVAA